MLNNRKCEVDTAEELDSEIRSILALEQYGRGDEIAGTLHIDYKDESVKEAALIGQLTGRGVDIVWRKSA